MTAEAKTISKDVARNIVTGLCVRRGQCIGFHENEWLEAEIEKAILSERERCAIIAEGNAEGFDLQRALADGDDMVVGAKSVQLAIARKIRGEG